MRHRFLLFFRVLTAVDCFNSLQLSAVMAADDDLFETQIRPTLVDQCFRCHGGEKTANHLRVDSRDMLIKGGDNGPAIVPGDVERSLLFSAIEHREGGEFQMPPGKKLPAETVQAFRQWIQKGANWPESAPGVNAFQHRRHWAFQPAKKIEPPAGDSGWSSHRIDRFIAEEYRNHNLRPSPTADRLSLVRRLYFDLWGLPPSREELDAAITNDSADAWPRLIDRLLDSPRYGERWGRYWMDVIRYADTAGDNADYPVPEARLYRDYIIDSFNADKPFDQFVQEQVAGDLLAAESAHSGGTAEKFAEQTIATGYLALSRRYATAPYELWHLSLEDTIDTVGRSILGLSFRCARCHDHKYDPITSEDYYAWYGIFSSTQFPWAGGEEYHSKQFGRLAFSPLTPPATVAPQLAAHAAAVEKLNAEISQLSGKDESKDRLAAAKAELRDLLRKSVPAEVPCAYAVREGTPHDEFLQVKGDPNQHGDVIPRRMPKFLNLPDDSISAGQSGRLQLARWLTRPDNPLTARVIVNRIWQHHFGTGLVATPSDFGSRGSPPTHPELLDFLANDFIEHGWSMKAMHRLILTSQTWQLSAAALEEAETLDPDNSFLAHFNRRRLDAEAIRDTILFVAGTLDFSRPGEHPFPEMTQWKWTQHAPFKDVYPSSHRSVYLMTQRLQRHPFLALFDGPDTNTTTDRRTSSIVPLQALFWMNSELVHEQAGKFGERLMRLEGDDATRLKEAFLWCFAREPRADESARYSDYLSNYRNHLRQTEPNVEVIETSAWTSLSRVLFNTNEFLHVD
jgi:hypothetical protein